MNTSLSKSKTVIRILRTGWRVRPRAIVGFFAGALLEISVFIVSIFATAKLGALLAAYIGGGSTGSIWFWLWVDIAAAALMGFAFWAMSYSKNLLYNSITTWSTRTFFMQMSRIDIADFYDEEIRNRINKAESGYSWQLSNLLSATLDLCYAFLRFISITIVVAQITWWILPIIIIFLIPSLIAGSKQAQMLWFVWDKKGDNRHVFWGLNYMIKLPKEQMEMRSTRANDSIVGKVDNMNREFYKEQEAEQQKANKFVVPSKFLEVIGTGAGSIVLLRQFLAGAISLERYFFLSGALLRIGGSLNNIFGTLSRMQEQILFAENFFELMDRKPTLVDKRGATKLPMALPKIEFKDVGFSYPNQDEVVFEHLNLVIEPGEHIAIIGENGAGKSTLIKLLLRFYAPTNGKILVNGQDLQAIDIASWYTQIATLFQTFNQYPFTIGDNIKVGRSHQTPNEADFIEAVESAGLREMVDGYKHGFDTVLDSSFEKGTEPSGGQWQRVALARAFYRRANVLILDEPTSAIDAKAEYDIFNNIFDVYKQKSVVIVSHRFSTVRRADRIIVLDKGRIIEQGSHKNLMKTKGLYYELFAKQAEGYK